MGGAGEREEERKGDWGAEQREGDGYWCQERPLSHAVSPRWLLLRAPPVSWGGSGRGAGLPAEKELGSPWPCAPGLCCATASPGDARIQLHGCLLGIAACQLQQYGHDVCGQQGRSRDVPASMQFPRQRGEASPPGSHPPSPATASEPRALWGGGEQAGRLAEGRGGPAREGAVEGRPYHPLDESLVSAPKLLGSWLCLTAASGPLASAVPGMPACGNSVPLGIPCLSGEGAREPVPWTCGARNRLHREVPYSPTRRAPSVPSTRGTALPLQMAAVR